MVENFEKHNFTFLAFLPPYVGVSSSLVSGMRKISMRSIDLYKKFLISWLAVRYSAVVFYMDYYYSPVRRGTTDRYPPTWSDGILIILRRLLLGPSLGELHFTDTPLFYLGLSRYPLGPYTDTPSFGNI